MKRTERTQWQFKIRPDLKADVQAFARRVDLSASIVIERALESFLVEIEDRVGDESDRLDAEILAERRRNGAPP